MKKLLLLCVLMVVFLGTFASVTVFADKANSGFVTSAKSAIVMEKTSHRVLFEKSADLHLPMASTTKIVTALTVIQNSNLDEIVQIPKEACGIEGSSIYLREGEHLTVRELLYGLMLRSGNDCAHALAIHVSGSIEAFAQLMNKTANSLGCRDSNFVNPHGLHNDNHYTSARDLATITCCALANDDFQNIVSTKSVRISNEGFEYDRVLVNKNKLLTRYDGADGVKTGFTKKAGRCFVGSATRNGMQVVVVVLNCGPMFEDTESMLNATFDNFKLETLIPVNKICGSCVENGERKYYVCKSGFAYPVSVYEELSTRICEDNTASIKVYVNGNEIANIPLEKVHVSFK